MAKTRQQKEKNLNLLKEKIEQSKSIILSTFSNVSVNDDQELRSKLREEGAGYRVVKKTLLQKAVEEKDVSGLPTDELVGNISFMTAEDEVSGSKALVEFSKDRENFKIIGGWLDKVWVDANQILELAKLPSKLELLGKTVGTIQAPISGFVNVLNANLNNLLNVLNNIKNNK